MVLQQQMSLRGLSEFVPYLVFADGDEGPVCRRSPFIFQHLDAVEIVFYMIVGIDDDPARIPLAHRVD